MDNGESNPSNIEAYGRPRVKWFGHTPRKTPEVFGLMHTSRCTRVRGQYPCIHISMGLKVTDNNK